MPLPALHTAGCLALGALLLFAPWPGGRGVSARRMVRVALVLAVVLTAELAVFYAMHTGFFLWITLVHRATFVVLPLLAVAVLVLALRHRPVGRTEVAATERPAGRAPTRPAVGLALVTLTLPPVGAHAAWVAPFDLQIERVDLDVAADLPRPVTVAILADLQCRRVGPYEEHAIDALLALEPDVILIPGDLLQTPTMAEYAEHGPGMRALLARLTAPGGVWFAQGNVDPWPAYHGLFEGTSVRALDDEVARVDLDGLRLAVAGLRLSGSQTPAGLEALGELQAEDDADLRLVVAHLPRSVLALPADAPVDLLAAGHTHGGQVVLPLLGPPVTLSALPRHVAAGGLHELDGNALYVSRGVGMERGPAPAVRFLCPPELTLVTLR